MTVVIFDSHGVEHVLVEDSLEPLGISAGSSPSLFLVLLQGANISNLASLLNGVSPAGSGAGLGS